MGGHRAAAGDTVPPAADAANGMAGGRLCAPRGAYLADFVVRAAARVHGTAVCMRVCEGRAQCAQCAQCLSVRACVPARVRACVPACVRACVRLCGESVRSDRKQTTAKRAERERHHCFVPLAVPHSRRRHGRPEKAARAATLVPRRRHCDGGRTARPCTRGTHAAHPCTRGTQRTSLHRPRPAAERRGLAGCNIARCVRACARLVWRA
jgi:hypothetical protein